MGDITSLLKKRLHALLDQEVWPTNEQEPLVSLMGLFATLGPPKDRFGLFPDYAKLQSTFLQAIDTGDSEAIEESFLNLYAHLHGHEAPYTQTEREQMDRTGGYWCHAGGLSPILKAGPHIRPHTVSSDYGAGNGLQGLLFQKLYPHKQTIQIEISSRMVAAGKDLQRWLSIDADRVTWIVGDVLDHPPREMDFIYLYRPVRPEGVGEQFYKQFAATLESTDHSVVIFSIADCLKDYLGKSFNIFYSDGHLTCFEKR